MGIYGEVDKVRNGLPGTGVYISASVFIPDSCLIGDPDEFDIRLARLPLLTVEWVGETNSEKKLNSELFAKLRYSKVTAVKSSQVKSMVLLIIIIGCRSQVKAI